jgi:predicted transporter
MKALGYILSVAGLAVIAFSNQISKSPILSTNPRAAGITVLTGAILIIIGIAFVMTKPSSKKSKIKQAEEEVPIYEGEGKERKIVAYKKESKK